MSEAETHAGKEMEDNTTEKWMAMNVHVTEHFYTSVAIRVTGNIPRDVIWQ